jgi:hypothetical protein
MCCNQSVVRPYVAPARSASTPMVGKGSAHRFWCPGKCALWSWPRDNALARRTDRSMNDRGKGSLSDRPMSQMGQSRRVDTSPAVAACPLRAERRQVGRHRTKSGPRKKQPCSDDRTVGQAWKPRGEIREQLLGNAGRLEVAGRPARLCTKTSELRACKLGRFF